MAVPCRLPFHGTIGFRCVTALALIRTCSKLFFGDFPISNPLYGNDVVVGRRVHCGADGDFSLWFRWAPGREEEVYGSHGCAVATCTTSTGRWTTSP